MRSPITFRQQSVTVEALGAMKESLLLDPHYQRQGDVWSRPRRRLLIDSLLNGFIVPPMYWHELDAASEYYDGHHRYAVVDGRQRLEAIFAFLDGEVSLGNENGLLADPFLPLDGLSIHGLQTEHPWLFAAFMRSNIEVVIIQTTEVDLIEELFSRLNEGVPLSAAEKRNRGVVLAPLVRDFAGHNLFFKELLPFGNNRYRHLDLLAKFMRIEDQGREDGKVPNLGKADLDTLFERLRSNEKADPDGVTAEVEDLLSLVGANLQKLTTVFADNDSYLSSVGMVTVYYAIAHYLAKTGAPDLDRSDVEHFEELRKAVKGKDDEDLTKDELQVVDFARYSQGTTAGSYLSARVRIFLEVERAIVLGDAST